MRDQAFTPDDESLDYDREAEDAGVVAALRAGLDDLVRNEGDLPVPLTRPIAISVLELLYECLSPALYRRLGPPEAGVQIVTDHHAMDLLHRLIGALGDLDNGKTHDALRRSDGANRSLTAEQRELDKVWLDTVVILQRAKGLPHRKAAEELFARALRKKGKQRLGKQITQRLLKSLRDRASPKK